jgi:hypothetical protein
LTQERKQDWSGCAGRGGESALRRRREGFPVRILGRPEKIAPLNERGVRGASRRAPRRIRDAIPPRPAAGDGINFPAGTPGQGGQPTDRDRRFDRSHRRWRDVPFAGRSRKRPGDGDEQDRRSCACRARLVCRARVPPVYPHKSRVRSFHQVSRLRDSRGVSRLTSERFRSKVKRVKVRF